VRLIQDQNRISVKVTLVKRFSQKDTVGHDCQESGCLKCTLPEQERVQLTLDLGGFGSAILETNSVTDFITELALLHGQLSAIPLSLESAAALTPISSLTRLATDIAATRRGCVHPIMP
jgi:hypothetical protein